MLKLDFSCRCEVTLYQPYQKTETPTIAKQHGKLVHKLLIETVECVVPRAVNLVCGWDCEQTYQPLVQHVKHHRGIDVIADHYATQWHTDQMASFPRRDGSSGSITTQQLIVRWQQCLCPVWTTTWWNNNCKLWVMELMSCCNIYVISLSWYHQCSPQQWYVWWRPHLLHLQPDTWQKIKNFTLL